MLPDIPLGINPFAGQPKGEMGIIMQNLASSVQQVVEQSADTNRVIAEHAQCEMDRQTQLKAKKEQLNKELTVSATQMIRFAAA